MPENPLADIPLRIKRADKNRILSSYCVINAVFCVFHGKRRRLYIVGIFVLRNLPLPFFCELCTDLFQPPGELRFDLEHIIRFKVRQKSAPNDCAVLESYICIGDDSAGVLYGCFRAQQGEGWPE